MISIHSINSTVTDDQGDGIDDNCDGITDDGFDFDGDGFSISDGDCDDSDEDISPSAIEIWYDGIDQDWGNDSDYDPRRRWTRGLRVWRYRL